MMATSPEGFCIHPERSSSQAKAAPNCKVSLEAVVGDSDIGLGQLTAMSPDCRTSPEAVIGHDAMKVGQLPMPILAGTSIQEVWVVHKLRPHLQGTGQQQVAGGSASQLIVRNSGVYKKAAAASNLLQYRT